MKNDHVLKMLSFDLPSPSQVSEGEGLQANYLIPCCSILDSLYFDIQHDHVLKKLDCDLLTPFQWSVGGGSANNHVAAFMIRLDLICNMTMF